MQSAILKCSAAVNVHYVMAVESFQGPNYMKNVTCMSTPDVFFTLQELAEDSEAHTSLCKSRYQTWY